MNHGPSLALKTTLNRQGYSDYNHKLLLEELRKLSGISMQEYSAILALSAQPEEKKSEITISPEDAGGKIVDLSPAKILAKDKKKFLKEIPEEVLATIKVRDEFPFLKELDCPNELKILVADRITAYHNYVDAHKRLFEAVTDQDLLKACEKVVENYLENCEIWDELKYYKETGTLLKKHPVFAEQDRMKEIQAMATPELIKLKNSLVNNINRTKKLVKDDPDNKETGNRSNRIANFEVELTEVNRLLGIGS